MEYEIGALGRAGGLVPSPQVVGQMLSILRDAGKGITGRASSQVIVARFVEHLKATAAGPSPNPATHRPSVRQSPSAVAEGFRHGLRPYQERLNGISHAGGQRTGATKSTTDLVGEANDILNRARREGRTQLTPAELKRFNEIATLAEAPDLQRAADRAQRRPRHPRPGSYRAEIVGRR